jgi:hypothetical protein
MTTQFMRKDCTELLQTADVIAPFEPNHWVAEPCLWRNT